MASLGDCGRQGKSGGSSCDTTTPGCRLKSLASDSVPHRPLPVPNTIAAVMTKPPAPSFACAWGMAPDALGTWEQGTSASWR